MNEIIACGGKCKKCTIIHTHAQASTASMAYLDGLKVR